MLRQLFIVLLLVPAACAWPLGSDPSVDPLAEFVEVMEAERRAAGCTTPLIWDEAIAAIARKHTIDMMVSNQVRHINAAGENVGTRLEQGGIRFRIAGENLAAGPVRGKRVLQLWYNSPGHRRNMLNCRFTHHGIGYENAYWTHVLVRYLP